MDFLHSFAGRKEFLIYLLNKTFVHFENINRSFLYHIVPVKVNISAGQSQFPEGSDISITCTVDGYPIPRVLWYKDDELIRTNNRIKISGKVISNNMQFIKRHTNVQISQIKYFL